MFPRAVDSIQWVSSAQLLRSVVTYRAIANNALGLSVCKLFICLGYLFFK